MFSNSSDMLVIHVYFLAFSLLIPIVLAEDKKSIFSSFLQNDYKLKFEWDEVNYYNPQYLEEFRISTFKYNRTCAAVNITFTYKVDMNNELELIAQTYKLASNEYRQFPLRLQVNFCDAIQNNLVGSHGAYNIGNFKGCPMKKGVRSEVYNFVPDQAKLPPFIPSGRYKVEAQGMYRDEEVFRTSVYGEVYRPVVKK